MSFLKNEVDSEERITKAIQGFSFVNNVRGTKPQKLEASSHNKNVVPTTADLVNCRPSKLACVFCEGSHHSDACFKAQKMSIEEKRDIANKKKCCFACLKVGHVKKRCRAVLKCIICEVSMCLCYALRVKRHAKQRYGQSSLSNLIVVRFSFKPLW